MKFEIPASVLIIAVVILGSRFAGEACAFKQDRPNVILCMADDLGWGDVGYNGHKTLKTPHLDEMSRSGIRFDRFYAAAPVCSPTRGSCLTGRHPYRYGVENANRGHLPSKEITLSEVLKDNGYRTGHFGKWHLGTLTRKTPDANRGGPRNVAHFAPPWLHGFDSCFSTESKVPTWNPMLVPSVGLKPRSGVSKDKVAGDQYGTSYWIADETVADSDLKGDDSRLIVDRAVSFIEESVAEKKPFFAVVWFHSPHLPVVAGEKYLSMYPDEPNDQQHYYGCITALDEQVGRLRRVLTEQRVDENTILFFCSDNGPEGNKSDPGSAGKFRGRKRSLYEGGVRVPGLMVWPKKFPNSKAISAPCCTSDYFPTVLAATGTELIETTRRPMDGINLLPLLSSSGPSNEPVRAQAIGFESKNQIAMCDQRYKIYSSDQGKTFELYDLIDDPSESIDLAQERAVIVDAMQAKLETWRRSCRDSKSGSDY